MEWLDQSIPFIHSITENALQYPLSFSSWLILFDTILSEPKEVVLIGSQEELSPFFKVLWSNPRFNCVIGHSDLPVPPNAPAILQDRTKINQKPTAYLCYLGVCKKPTTDYQEFDKMLRE